MHSFCTYNSIKLWILSQRSIRGNMCSAVWALMSAFGQALLNAKTAETMTTLWVEMRVGTIIKTDCTSKLIFHEIIKQR